MVLSKVELVTTYIELMKQQSPDKYSWSNYLYNFDWPFKTTCHDHVSKII